MKRPLSLGSVTALLLLAAIGSSAAGFLPGKRVLLDAHNCYPYEGRWQDRLERALATGFPAAIECDLVWDTNRIGVAGVVLRHGGRARGDEPTLRDFFFEKVRPNIEKALREGLQENWPLLTLNVNDLRASEPEFFAALWELMGRYESWLCTAEKTADSAHVGPLEVRPVLVLTSDGSRQAKVFYEEVPVGGRLRMFATGSTGRKADNFRRWINYPWSKVEPEGQARAGDWTGMDGERLKSAVDDAHAQGYWIRFYTLNGHGPEQSAGQGWSPTYNFGSVERAAIRWRAARSAGVDFVASDQYEECAKVLRSE